MEPVEVWKRCSVGGCLVALVSWLGLTVMYGVNG